MYSMRVDEPGDVSVPRLDWSAEADPVAGAGQVVVDVEVCAMCRTDLQIVEGDLAVHRESVIPGHQVVGRIRSVGDGVDPGRIGQRVGMAWLAFACGHCKFCLRGQENLCELAKFTGWDVDGGYATSAVAYSDFAFDLSALAGRSSASIAPLLCAGVIGYRALRIAEIDAASAGKRLGLFGYGASARQVMAIAQHWKIDTYVVTRSTSEIAAALDAGAVWAGTYDEQPPVPLDSAITFAPVGSVVIKALSCLDRGGIVAINAIHLDEIPSFNYDDLWWERSIRSIANVTKADVREYIDLVAQAGLQTTFEELPLSEANTGLQRIKSGDVEGSFVLISGG